MKNKKVLVTCPPMLGMLEEFQNFSLTEYSIDLISANVKQTLSESELINIIGDYDGWIIGDDPATRKVFEKGKSGNLKAAVKWGVGTDNVDFKAASELGIPVINTPGMFGNEVADLAFCYIVCLARNVIPIHNGITKGGWPKIRGESLKDSNIGLIGFGDIGKNLTKRLLTSDARVQIYDPFVDFSKINDERISLEVWPNKISNCDYIVLTCSLNSSNYHLFNKDIFTQMKNDVKIINVSRGGLINEDDLVHALEIGKVNSVALDVFEEEPLPLNCNLRKFDNCIFGSHNASNTTQAVRKTSFKTIEIIYNQFKNYPNC